MPARLGVCGAGTPVRERKLGQCALHWAATAINSAKLRTAVGTHGRGLGREQNTEQGSPEAPNSQSRPILGAFYDRWNIAIIRVF